MAQSKQVLCGIYQIRHTDSGKIYLGSACNLTERWREHRRDLNARKHHNRYLQNAWNKHGAEAFVFEILFLCDISVLASGEQHEIDERIALFGRDSIYNIYLTAYSPVGVSVSEETRRKISIANKGRKRTDEIKAKLSASRRGGRRSLAAIEKTALWHRGRKRPKETCAKISAAHKGRIMSPEWIEKIANASRGRKHSPEHIAKLVASRARTRELKKQQFQI